MLATIEFIAGLVVAGMTLRDFFETVLVPGESCGPLRVVHRIVTIAVRLRLGITRKKGIRLGFAPAALLLTFITWLVLLTFGFALMAHAVRNSFHPALENFSQALYAAGSGLVTLGFGTSQPSGIIARLLVLASGFCGLSVVTMAITYLIEIQNAITGRDTGILKLLTSAGEPPSAIGLLERYARLGCKTELPDVLRDARDWCAGLHQTHRAHPTLVYFRSNRGDMAWPGALGVLLDIALTLQLLLNVPQARAGAVLLYDEAVRVARELTQQLTLDPKPSATSHDDVHRAMSAPGESGL